MKILHINLQPGGIERKKKEFLRQTFKQVILGEVILLLFLFVINLFFSLEIRALKNRLALVDKEWQATEPLLKEREYLLQWKDGYSEVFAFLKGAFTRDLSWPVILKKFSSLVPEEMWFKEMVLRGEGAAQRVLEIKASIGYLESDEKKLDKMNSFIEAAKKDTVFSENFEIPDLQDITKTKAKDEDVLDLKFSLTLKK
jgi:hypothetical protein